MYKTFQYELWHECNSQCKFCFLSKRNFIKETTDKKMQSLFQLNKELDNLDTNIYKTVGIIGGEFFQGQIDSKELEALFISTILKMYGMRKDNKINSIWITATLTIGDQKLLYKILDIAKEADITNLWICTSWDSVGRFHTDKMLETWEYNMHKIHNDYPTVKLNTSIILTEDLLQKYINNEFNPKEFSKTFNTSLFYKPAILPREFEEEKENSCDKDFLLTSRKKMQEKMGINFYPKRSTMLKFLQLYSEKDPDTFDKIYNNLFRSSEAHFTSMDGKIDSVISTRSTDITKESLNTTTPKFLPCGHPVFYGTYIDSTKCFICDKNAISGNNN